MYDYKRLEEDIINAAELLKRKAADISAEVMEENVSDIYMTIHCIPGENVTLEIDKTYVC